MTGRQIRDVFGATGSLNEDGEFVEYKTEKEAAKVKGAEPKQAVGGPSFFKQADPIDDGEPAPDGSDAASTAEQTAKTEADAAAAAKAKEAEAKTPAAGTTTRPNGTPAPQTS